MSILHHKIAYARLSLARRSAFDKLSPSLIADAMGGLQTMDSGIRPLTPGARVLGQARTVLMRGSNAPAIAAIPLARRGEVLVIDAGDDLAHAAWGDITTLEAARRGIAGVIVGGAVRDVTGIREIGLPLFCRGVVARGPARGDDGAIDVPITVGGAIVRPGDVIMADDDGIVVVPLDELDAVIVAAKDKARKEKGWVDAVKAGGTLAAAIGILPPVER